MALKRKRPVHRQDDSNKRHKFESFSDRIEKLSIDVLRKVRPVIPDSGADDEDSYAFSYFSESVKRWRELNLSATFTEFYKRVLALSESLPQVVHHQDTIMDLLEEYILKQDELSLISLLDMLVQFARDLGEDFYAKYWDRTITLLSQTVKHTDFSVIEAAFNTISWLLKYLARPLVSNLPTTFHQFAPLLGKIPQKQYIRRFASEAFAFLLRRVKNPAEIVEIMLSDIEDNEIYVEGITNIFIESMKAPARNLHSKAVTLFRTLVQGAENQTNPLSRQVPRNVLDQVLYDTSKEHFSPILDAIIVFLKDDHQELASDLLLLCCTFKDGARIKDWSALVSPLTDVIGVMGLDSKSKCLLAATVVANADPITSKSITGKVFEIVKLKDTRQIGAFCQLVGNLNENVFQQLVLEELVKYVNQATKEEFDDIALTLITLKQKGLLTPATAKSKDENGRLNGHLIKAQSPFMTTLCVNLSHETAVPADTAQELALWRDLQLLELMGVRSESLRGHLNNLLLAILKTGNPLPNITGLLLSVVAEDESPDSMDQILELLYPQMESLCSAIAFLDGLENFIPKLSSPLSTTSETCLRKCYPILQTNLSKPSHLIRSSTLRILQQLSEKLASASSSLLEALVEIENTPRTVDNIRSTSVAMRRLPLLFSKEHDLMLITFCFGLLTVNFAPLWNDVCSVLKAIVERSGAAIWEVAFSRLTHEEASSTTHDDNGTEEQTDDSAVSESATDELWNNCQGDSYHRLQSLYARDQERNTSEGHTSPRSQCLRALLEIPKLSEQHSRDLVPLFLSLENPTEVSQTWHRKDRISMLTLFTKFTNPRGLYKSSEVRSTLYTLLQKGDQKIQKLALDAILTWKDVELTTYRQNLHNLLDDKKFREELTSLVHVDAEQSPVQEEHRKGLMEVVVRILFGNALVRHGSGDGKRSAILSALANVRDEERKAFIDLSLLPFLDAKGLVHTAEDGLRLDKDKMSIFVDERKMMGFVNMIQNLAKTLGAGITPYLEDVLEALIVCMWKSKLASDVDIDTNDEAEVEFAFEESSTKIARAIRKASMKVLIMLINTCQNFEWAPYVQVIFREFIAVRLDNLSDENIQSPSSRLQFFATLAKYPKTVLSLSRCDRNIIPNVLRCLENRNANLSVFEMVLGLFVDIFRISQDESIHDQVMQEIVFPYLNDLLDHLTPILATVNFQAVVNSKQTLDPIIDVLRFSAPFVKTGTHAEHLMEPLISLLQKSGRLVNEKIKIGILESVVELLPLCSDFRPEDTTFESRLVALSALFGTLGHRNARTMLCQAIDLFAEADPLLAVVGTLVTDLNAYDMRRLDLPDFDRRLAAFGKLNEEYYNTFTARAWTPIVYNMLYFVQDAEEMSLRTGAAFNLQKFFTAARTRDLSPDYIQLLSSAVFPAVKKGLKHSNELVRREFTGILDSLVKTCGQWSAISDLQVLLADGDEEANFFHNINHIQQHRRLRAIVRLSRAANDGVLKSANIEQIFIPMLEQFSLDSNVESHNIAAEAIRGLGSLSGALGWKSYRQLVKRYLSMLKIGDDKERPVVRTICAVVEMAGKVAENRMRRASDISVAESVQGRENNSEAEKDFLIRAALDEFYPPMLQYLHHHEESSLALRVPVAIALVKVLQTLPEHFLVAKLPAVLTDVCHILKSRSQEARDTCRKTLNEIMTLLGPRFFSFILKELKAALARGYQLHVLGYTVHSLLTHLSTKVGDLDACVKDIVDVLIGDIFGATGSEKESEGYTSAMKEVKKNKSYDSFEVLASITSIEKMPTFLLPLKTFLYEMGSVKEERKMNEVLRRIHLGIMRNHETDSTKVLDFCISFFKTIQSEAAHSDQPKSQVIANQFIVDLKFRKTYQVNHFKENAPKLLRFALDTISALLKKYEYLLRDEKVAALVPVLGDCLVSSIDELRIPSLRLLGRLISLPISSIEEGTDVFVDRAVQFVKESPVTKSELCQASLKFLSLLLRDRKTFEPRENTIVYLLERIRADLEEPERQGVSFSLIRAILARQLVITEVYDIMADVANIMITNQSRSVRDTTRALYLQFLMDYPQGRDRLKKQISFLMKNLQYEHETGRQSVMEVLHQILNKFGDELLQPVLLDLFVGLLLPLANDESTTCREMAAKLIQLIIENADDDRLKAIRTMLRLWTQQMDKPALRKSSLHVYRVMLENRKTSTDDIGLCFESVTEIVGHNVVGEKSKVTWEVIEQALEVLIKLAAIDPSRVFSSKEEKLWSDILGQMACEDTAVRLAASKLVGLLFSRGESLSDGQFKVESLCLRVPSLTASARHSLEQIKDPNSTPDLGTQAVKNLIFLGQHFYKTNCDLPQKKESAETNGDLEVISCLTWLVSRVAAEIRYERTVAEHVGLTRKRFVQWMVAMISILDAEDLFTRAKIFLSSLSRFTEEVPVASILKSSLKDTREIAEEGLKLMQSKLGTTAYLEHFNWVRQRVIGKRHVRKVKRSIEVVTDPEKAAKKKIRLHEKAKESRKRKVEDFKRKRLTFGN